MRHSTLLAMAAIALLVPGAQAREIQDLGERVRDAVQRTDKDLGNCVHPDKLNEQQRARLDAAVKDLRELRDAVAAKRWQGERDRLVRAVDNIDSLDKNAPLDDGDRQTLDIDLYTLRVILDSWKP